MSVASRVSLLSLRTQTQQRADMENSRFLTTIEWNTNLTNSYKELYDLLIAAYGEDYYFATPYTFQTDGTNQFFDLPTDFYKLLGVDLALSTSLDSYVTIRPFRMAERNRYAVPNFQSFYGVTNLRYRLAGDQLWLTPIPSGGQTIQVWYAPEPTNLQYEFFADLDDDTAVVDVSDTSFLSVGMKVVGDYITSGTTILSIVEDNSITLSEVPYGDSTGVNLFAYSDQTVIDGISGWEEYIIVDAAIKARIKEESDITELSKLKEDMRQRLILMAEDRDASAPAVVSDTQWSDYGWPDGSGAGWWR